MTTPLSPIAGGPSRSVFISSTYEDLQAYRRRVWEVLRSYVADVRGMEQFGARKEAPLQTCLAEVEQCDIFVCIVAFRLGSVDATSGKSFTQREYDQALALSKELLIYIMDDSAAHPPRFVDRGEDHEKLTDFKRLLRDRHTVASFTSPDDLAGKLERDLRRLLSPRESVSDDRISPDEFAASADTLRSFLLVPAEYADQQVRLVVKTTGPVFPASKEICDALQLRFGRTVGVRVAIERPEGFRDSGLNVLLARAEHLDRIHVSQGTRLDIYADLQFADKKISRIIARFKAESHSYISAMSVLAVTPQMETLHYEADSTVALLLDETTPLFVASPPAG